ncbi:MAG: SurA N-terminal domain-containing protein [Deltaproteobacteria bacterium]|nr:SurA N-terminal domain-containing protein [Deltaproteobacteria bacterium]
MQPRSIFKACRAFLSAVAVVLGACGWIPVSLHAEVVDRILAVVNDDIVTLYEFNQAFKPYETRIRSLNYPPEKERQMLKKVRGDVLNQLIDEKLTEQEIQQLNLSVSETEIENTIERFKAANKLTDAQFQNALVKEGLSLEEYRKQVKDQLLRAKLVNRQVKSKIVITKEEIQRYYESHPERYGPKARYRLRHIFMRVPNGAGKAERAQKKKQMERILEELKRGAPFAALASRHSEVAAEDGGLLGLFDFEELSQRLRETLTGKGAGEFTGLLETEQGYQIVYIDEIVEIPAKEVDEVSAEIEEKLFQEQIKKRYDAWLEEIRTQSIVKRID